MIQKATLTVTEAAEMLGISRNAAYAAAARDKTLAGVPVIQVGERRLVIPRAPLERILGITTTTQATDDDISQLS
ncbi:hypothetical protein BH23ACT4_BH23ACT4_03680 [soil metagenome]